MGAKKFGSMEIDAIGEVLNISLGSSATAVSTMLDSRVDITTPIVKVVTRDEFEFDELKPAIGVEINYIAGLEGKNVMLLKRNDVRIILNMLMGTDTPLEEFEMDEMSISAICEVMNQMMGASATALSELLGRSVNISTPQSFEIGSSGEFKDKYFENNDVMVVVSFTLKIADQLESEFMNLMPVDLAKELVASLLGDYYVGDEEEEDGEAPAASAPTQNSAGSGSAAQEETSSMPMSQAAIDAALAAALGTAQGTETAAAPQTAPAPAQPLEVSTPQPFVQPAQPANMAGAPAMAGMPASLVEAQMQQMQQMQQQIMMQMQQMQQLQQLQQAQMEEAAKAAPKEIKVHAAPQPNMSAPDSPAVDGDANLDLVMGVPVEVSVEIGRTRKFVRDVLELNKGSLVVLDKLAGEQVDLYVNGQCIAKGDVVVVDDNFGIRITQILRDEINLI